MHSYRLRADGRVQRHHGYSGRDPLPDCQGSGMMPLREPPSPGLAKLAALEPRRIIVAGDWHGNTGWAVRVIKAAKRLLRDEPLPPLILHCGDFGIWPGAGGKAYLREVQTACAELGVRIWFIDGNHEDFTQLERFRDGDPRWLPRGTRWNWHGRTWLALGGGVSLDKAIRTEGRDWWPEEEITAEQAAEVTNGGPAHVMVTHDCPVKVAHSFPPPPSFWDPRDLARNARHRERLQRVVDRVRPGWLLHGHLHRSYQLTANFAYGPCEVTGLDCDGGRGANWAVLDVKRMAWGETGGSLPGAGYAEHRAADVLAAITEELGLYGEVPPETLSS